jgi:hypothetical protein
MNTGKGAEPSLSQSRLVRAFLDVLQEKEPREISTEQQQQLRNIFSEYEGRLQALVNPAKENSPAKPSPHKRHLTDLRRRDKDKDKDKEGREAEALREQFSKKVKALELDFNKRLRLAEEDIHEKLRPDAERKDRKIKQLEG